MYFNKILIFLCRVELLRKFVFGVDLQNYSHIYNAVAASDNYVHEKASKESAWQAFFYFYRWYDNPAFKDVTSKVDIDLLRNSYVSNKHTPSYLFL